MKLIPFLSAAVPSLLAISAAASSHAELSWIAAGGVFYAGLALAELVYLTVAYRSTGSVTTSDSEAASVSS